jgi:hypothetical protein
MIRTQHIPFIQSRAATPVIHNGLDYGFRHTCRSRLWRASGNGATPSFPWLAGILLSCALTQLVKQLYRRFGQWL